MPDHWQRLTLGDVLTHRPGKYLKKDDYAAGGQFAVYGSNSVMGSHSEALFDGPLVVMAGIGAYAGAVRLSKIPCWVNNNAFAIFACENTDIEWLYLWLDHALDLGFVRRATAQPYIDKSVLMLHPILVPPPEEQRRIVDLVGSIDTYIDSLESQIETTRTGRSALLSELLSNPGDDWQETTLGEIADLEIGRTPPRKSPEYWTESLQRPFCSIADMVGRVVTPSREGVTELAEVDNKARRVTAGSLLMSFKLTIGRVAFAGCDLFPNEAIVAITPNPVTTSREFLYLYLGSRDLTEGSGQAVKGKTLNSKSLRAIGIHLPSLVEQQEIVDLVGSIDEQISSLESQVESVRTFRQSVLSELLSGERLLDESYDVAVGL